MKTFLLEVLVTCDSDEVDTHEKSVQKEKEIRRAIENLDPAIGIFEVNFCQKD